MKKGTKKERGISLRRSYANIYFILKMVAGYTPGFFVNYCLYQIYCAAEVFVEFTVTMKVLLDLIARGGTFEEAIRFLMLILTLVLIKLVWAAVMENYTMPRAKETLKMKLQMQMYEKAVSLDLDRYDNPQYYNEFVWSINEAGSRTELILRDFASLLTQLTRIVTNGIFFLSLDALGIVFVAVSLLITVAANSRIGRLNFARDTELNPIERRRSYFNRVFYLSDYAKELRLNPLADRLKEQFSETNSQVYPIVKKYGKRQMLIGFVGGFLPDSILIDTFYLGYLVYKTVVLKALSYGSTMALFSAASSLRGSLQNLSGLFPKFEQHGLYVEKIRTFLDFESAMETGGKKINPEDFRELTVENVSFAYGQEQEILHDINMSVKAGEKIAIVGYNGAGKSTLIKLLLRLYDTGSGTVKVNGRDIREYDMGSYRSLFASVFQDYKIFAATVADNVRMETLGVGDDMTTRQHAATGENEQEHFVQTKDFVEAAEEDAGKVEHDETVIRRALSESGFNERLKTLPKGIHTQLTREFDEEGVNLSGGESQKVAIARTFYRYCPVIILDEPSSALDPISEYNLNETMRKAAEKKAVIFISHRLSSTVMADRIYMLEKGRIIECGSHKELMERNGKYAEMFRLQAEKYRQAW